jgi:adenylate cyclase
MPSGSSENNQKHLPPATDFLTRVLLPLACVLAALAIQFTDPPFHTWMRNFAFDQLQISYPLPYHDELPVRVIAIDDASLDSSKLGQWPWPRNVLAKIVDRLTDMGAGVIVFDIILSESDRASPEQVSAYWPKQQALKDLLKHIPDNDKILAESFSRSKVVTGFPVEHIASSKLLPPAKTHFTSVGGNAGDFLPHYSGGLASLPLLTNAAAGSGSITWDDPEDPSNDGVLRKLPMIYQVKDALYPGLDLEALRLLYGQDNIAIKISATATTRQKSGIMGINLGGDFIPTEHNGQIWLHFRALADERYIPAWELLEGKVDGNKIKDHIVYIAATAKGLGDTAHTPLGELIPGVEGHVQLVEQLMTGDSLSRTPWENYLVVVTVLGSWLLLWIFQNRFRPVWSVLLIMLLIAGLVSLAGWLFHAHKMLLDPIYPSLVVSSLFVVMTVPLYLQTEQEQRWIRNAFSRYVSPNRVKFLQENHQQLELGAIYRECSFVMTDLAGFTALMEKYEPALLCDLLNEYLEGMIKIAFRHDGTLDRIVGDAVAVMFSAPLLQPDHAARALACALEMDVFAQKFSHAQSHEKNIPFGVTRIGVNTGNVLVGNFGGKTMLDYRALGDAINTASRLESINKQFSTRICVSGSTVAQCNRFTGRPCGLLVLKGKTEAVATYEPLTEEQLRQPYVVEYLAAYALMEAENPEAIEIMLNLAVKYPDDPLANYHAKRLIRGQRGSRIVLTDK